MSIATEIQRLQTAKSDIKTAIEAKGVTVPSSAKIDTYDDYVAQIEGGGGCTCDTCIIYKNGTFGNKYATSIVMSDNVTSIENGMFSGATSLSSVTIGNSVTTIGTNAFSGCTSLTDIDIPDSVTSILSENAFKYCSRLTGVTIGSGLTIIGTAAFSRIGATELDFPDTLTTIGSYACDWSTGLTTVTIGSGCTSIQGKAFDHCTSLSSVTITATTPPTLGTAPFSNTSSNLVIYVPSGSVDAYKAASNWSTYASRIQAIPT